VLSAEKQLPSIHLGDDSPSGRLPGVCSEAAATWQAGGRGDAGTGLVKVERVFAAETRRLRLGGVGDVAHSNLFDLTALVLCEGWNDELVPAWYLAIFNRQ